ncbi:MarR family winged helix-turn-helix transcriptional regulator [Aeromonas caviae]
MDLAERLDIQPITLARQLDQLAESGLVERRSDPHDRRAYQLHLTEGPPLSGDDQTGVRSGASEGHRRAGGGGDRGAVPLPQDPACQPRPPLMLSCDANQRGAIS